VICDFDHLSLNETAQDEELLLMEVPISLQ